VVGKILGYIAILAGAGMTLLILDVIFIEY
jgi:hypothetical protein